MKLLYWWTGEVYQVGARFPIYQPDIILLFSSFVNSVHSPLIS